MKDFINEVELLVKLRHLNIVQFLAAAITKEPPHAGHRVSARGRSARVDSESPVACRPRRHIRPGHSSRERRDLKPRNLIIGESNKLKVGDFGLSKLIRVTNVHDVYKLTGETGSYRYMAPEVFLRENYNTKVDVFSFGMILYEMFEGEKPFAREDAYEAAYLVAREGRRPQFGSKTYSPDGMKELITKCWSDFAVKRPQFDDNRNLWQTSRC